MSLSLTEWVAQFDDAEPVARTADAWIEWAITADSEGWRKWCEANPEKCTYQPKGKSRISPVRSKPGAPKTIAVDLTMENLDEVEPGIADRVVARFNDGLGVTPREAVDNMVDMADDALADGVLDEYKDWYDRARSMSVDAGTKDGRDFDPEVACAVMAACSPGCEWKENVRQADILMGMVARNDTIDKAYANELLSKQTIGKDGTAKTATDYRLDRDMTLKELIAVSPEAAGVYIGRYGDNHFQVQGYDKLEKAVQIAASNDPKDITRLLEGPKVRSFFNNISEPRSIAGDVTVDRHMMRALVNGRNDDEAIALAKFQRVKANNTKLTGDPAFKKAGGKANIGAYPLMSDKIRQATNEFNHKHGLALLPHQFQAVVWGEQLRRFPDRRTSAMARSYNKSRKAKTSACEECGAILADSGETARERWARWDAEHPRERHPRERKVVVESTAINAMREALRAEGGFTINPRTGSGYDNGFSAAIPNHSAIIPEDKFFADDDTAKTAIKEWVRANADVFDADPELNFGGWIDTEHGEVVLDPSKHFDSRDEAIQRGVEWDQQEIWDHANKVGIKTGGTGQRQAASLGSSSWVEWSHGRQ